MNKLDQIHEIVSYTLHRLEAMFKHHKLTLVARNTKDGMDADVVVTKDDLGVVARTLLIHHAGELDSTAGMAGLQLSDYDRGVVDGIAAGQKRAEADAYNALQEQKKHFKKILQRALSPIDGVHSCGLPDKYCILGLEAEASAARDAIVEGAKEFDIKLRRTK